MSPRNRNYPLETTALIPKGRPETLTPFDTPEKLKIGTIEY